MYHRLGKKRGRERMIETELTIEIKKAMRKKEIQNYTELLKISQISIPHKTRLCDILRGKQYIKEKDLIKLAETLEIPINFFTDRMEKEIKYKVTELKFVPEDYSDLQVRKRIGAREYNRLYQRRRRAIIKAQKRKEVEKDV